MLVWWAQIKPLSDFTPKWSKRFQKDQQFIFFDVSHYFAAQPKLQGQRDTSLKFALIRRLIEDGYEEFI
jgi:hypothetical protein